MSKIFQTPQRRRSFVLAASAAALLAAQPLQAADLIIAMPASIEPANLDYQVDPYTPAVLLNSFMTDPLIVPMPDGSYGQGLATSWQVSPDAKSYVLHLRQGVTFQDGTPFNAQAVVYNINRTLAPETASGLLAAQIGPLDKVEAVDDYTVKFTYKEPWVTFLEMATKAPMWSPTAAAASTPQEFDKKLIGTGPFKLKEWVPNQHILMERWADYGGWNQIQEHKGAALVDSVTLRFIGEPAVLGGMVLNGEAHAAYMIPPLSAQDYQSSDAAEVLSLGQPGVGLQMVFNTTKPPLNDVRVRQAMLYGRDMAQGNDVLYDGLYGASDGPLNNIHACHWAGAQQMYKRDVAKAQALLEEAGWLDDGSGIRKAKGVEGIADGTPLSILWTTLHHTEIGEFVQAQLKEIGMDLQVEAVPGPIQLERVKNRSFDLIYARLRSPDPQILDDLWNPANTHVGGWSWSGYANADLTAQLDIIRTNPDNNQRCDAAKSAQEHIMNNALMFPTLTQPTFFAVSSKVEGFKLGAEGTRFFLHDIALTE